MRTALRHNAPVQLSRSPVAIEWLSTLDELHALEEQWRGLEAGTTGRSVLATFDYNAAWYESYGGLEGDMLIGVARRGRDLAGIAPLVVRRRRVGRIPLTCVEFVPHDAYAGEFLIEDGDTDTAAAFVDALAGRVPYDIVCLNGIDVTAPGNAALRNVVTRRRLGVEVTNHPNAEVDLSRGYETYLGERNSHLRIGVRRHARLIEEAGGGAVEGVQLLRGLETLERSIERMIAINEASYKLEGHRLADCHRRFLSALARRFGSRGMLSLPILTVGGRDAAFVIGLVERQRFYDVTLAYDEAFARLSPGSHLTQESLRQLADAGIQMFVSHGAHDYKNLWASELVPCPRLFLFAPNVRGMATRFLRFSLHPLWRRLGASEP